MLAMAAEPAVGSWRQPTREPEIAATETTDEGGVPGAAHSGHNPFYGPLWIAGIAQSYRLFDWIDDRNWDIRYRVTVHQPGEEPWIDPDDQPLGDSIRHVLVQANLHGVTWLPVPWEYRLELRREIALRYGASYCQVHNLPPGSMIGLTALVRRITVSSSIDRQRHPEPLATLTCTDSRAAIVDLVEPGGQSS